MRRPITYEEEFQRRIIQNEKKREYQLRYYREHKARLKENRDKNKEKIKNYNILYNELYRDYKTEYAKKKIRRKFNTVLGEFEENSTNKPYKAKFISQFHLWITESDTNEQATPT